MAEQKVKDMHMLAMRVRSGHVKDTDPLVSLLYSLIISELPVGRIEKLMIEIDAFKERQVKYTNGWIAKYAQDLAFRLRPTAKGTEKDIRDLLDTYDDALCNHEHGDVAANKFVDGVRGILGVGPFERRRPFNEKENKETEASQTT